MYLESSDTVTKYVSFDANHSNLVEVSNIVHFLGCDSTRSMFYNMKNSIMFHIFRAAT